MDGVLTKTRLQLEIEREQEQLQRQVAQVKRDSKFIQLHYERIIERVCDAQPALGLYCSLTYGWTHLQLQLAVESIAEAVPLVKGLVQEDSLAIVSAPAADIGVNRVWKFRPRYLPDEEVHVYLYLSISARRCSQVQVGTKEVPIMETRCDWSDGDAALGGG